MVAIKEVLIIVAVVSAKLVRAEDDKQAKPALCQPAVTSTIQKPLSSTTFPPDLIDRFPELTTLNRRPTPTKIPQTSTARYVKPLTVLDYKPITSFYHPHPVTLAQIIPPGKPWPASAEKPSTTSSTEMAPQTLIPAKNQTTEPPQLTERFPELTTLSSKQPSTTTETLVAQTVLEYKPIIAFHHPNPVTLGQIIPPGKPWPASPEEYTSKDPSVLSEATIPNFADRLPDLTTTRLESQTVLEYKPITGSFHPKPVTIAQIVPPGKPWPASSENSYKLETTFQPNLEDRLPETTITSLESTTIPTITTKGLTTTSNHLILTYKPQRPWYHPRPGNTVAQIIPPGKPWPASAAGYVSFSVTTRSPWLKEANELQSLKEEPSLVPNALQYYGPKITAPSWRTTAAAPFTSGTQETTISDFMDILKEARQKMASKSAPQPSDLLPFAIVRGKNRAKMANYAARAASSANVYE